MSIADGVLGRSAESQLAERRKTRELIEAGKTSLELARLQNDNARLRGEAFDLRQRQTSADADRVDLAGKLAGEIHRQLTAAAPATAQAAAPAETTRQRDLRQRIEAGTATATDRIEYGMSAAPPAAPQSAAPPAAAAAPQQTAADLSKLNPVQLIEAGLAQSKPAR